MAPGICRWLVRPRGGQFDPASEHMIDSIEEMQRLLKETVESLQAGRKSDRRKAIESLNRLAAVATTLALTLQSQQSRS
jgi:hypothetical protein